MLEEVRGSLDIRALEEFVEDLLIVLNLESAMLDLLLCLFNVFLLA